MALYRCRTSRHATIVGAPATSTLATTQSASATRSESHETIFGGVGRPDDPRSVSLPSPLSGSPVSAHRHSLNNPGRVTGSGVVAVQDGCANASGTAAADADKQQRGEGRRRFSAVSPLSVALGPQSHPRRPANSIFGPCWYSDAVTRQAADLGLCLVVQRTGMCVRCHSLTIGNVPDLLSGSRLELGGQLRGHESGVLHFDALDCGSIMTSMRAQLHRMVRICMYGASAPDRRLVRVGEASSGCEVASVRIPRLHLRSGGRRRR